MGNGQWAGIGENGLNAKIAKGSKGEGEKRGLNAEDAKATQRAQRRGGEVTWVALLATKSRSSVFHRFSRALLRRCAASSGTQEGVGD